MKKTREDAESDASAESSDQLSDSGDDKEVTTHFNRDCTVDMRMNNSLFR